MPEVYEFLVKLEGFLGKPILRLNPDRDFDFWLKQYNNFLPSAQTRWCTRQLKLRPFEQWIRPLLDGGDRVYSYVAIRADEEYREGYASKHTNLVVRLPFKDAGIDKAGVLKIWRALAWVCPNTTNGGPGAAARFVSFSKRSSGFGSGSVTRTIWPRGMPSGASLKEISANRKSGKQAAKQGSLKTILVTSILRVACFWATPGPADRYIFRSPWLTPSQ